MSWNHASSIKSIKNGRKVSEAEQVCLNVYHFALLFFVSYTQSFFFRSLDTPYLYDFVMTHSQAWPSLTCEWLPPVRILNDQVAEHRLLIGTQTNCAEKEQNYLVEVACTLPREEAVVNPRRNNNSAQDDVVPGKFEIKRNFKHEGEVNR